MIVLFCLKDAWDLQASRRDQSESSSHAVRPTACGCCGNYSTSSANCSDPTLAWERHGVE